MESRIYNAIAASSKVATGKKWLILDARGVELYRQGHIKGSVCVRLSSSCSTLVKVAGKAPFSANCWWGRHVLLVLPDSRKRKRHHDPVLQFLSKEGFVESLMILGPNPDADEPTSNIAQCFEPANKFILDAETKGGRVLVHCAAGVSRSATLCAAYLMQSKNWNVEDTLEYLKQKRGQINPNQGFVSALYNYHKQISCLPKTRDVQSVVNPSSPSGDKDNGNDFGDRFQLEVQKNGCKIEDITIVQGQPIVFGRASSCNIVLDHASISRQHAKMELFDQAVILTDLKSSHGTFVNGQILQKGESISLNKSDKVTFGASSRYYILRD